MISDKCDKGKGDHETGDHHFYWITIEEYVMQSQDVRNKELSKKERR